MLQVIITAFTFCIVSWPRIAEQTNKQRADDASPYTALAAAVKYDKMDINTTIQLV